MFIISTWFKLQRDASYLKAAAEFTIISLHFVHVVQFHGGNGVLHCCVYLLIVLIWKVTEFLLLVCDWEGWEQSLSWT